MDDPQGFPMRQHWHADVRSGDGSGMGARSAAVSRFYLVAVPGAQRPTGVGFEEDRTELAIVPGARRLQQISCSIQQDDRTPPARKNFGSKSRNDGKGLRHICAAL